MARRRYHTDFRLWALASAGLFVAFGFVDPLGGVSKGSNSLWGAVRDLFRWGYAGSPGDVLAGLVGLAMLPAMPAVALGWVVQAFVVIARRRVRDAAAGGRP
jgi:hypothetical protein